ncbi:MAG: molybdopterin-guanine dinucleotide biosynthesis protein B [Candidatus Eisenbacteria bacterium]
MTASSKGRIIGVVGWKDSGKTQVVERLVRVLGAGGFVVGTVKHVHDEVSLEPGAKDSTRHLDAGAACTVTLGGGLSVVLRREDDDLEQVTGRYLSLCDCVVVEGFKQSGIAKIAVVSDGNDLPEGIENVVAVVYRGARPHGCPAYTIDEIDSLCEFLLKEGILREPGRQATLLVDGRPVRMNDFVQTSLTGVIQGFLASLRDVKDPSTIELSIKLDKPAR